MVESRYPLLVFPRPAHLGRAKRQPGFAGLFVCCESFPYADTERRYARRYGLYVVEYRTLVFHVVHLNRDRFTKSPTEYPTDVES